MKRVSPIVVAALATAGLTAAAMAESGQVFKLERQPLPSEGAEGVSWMGTRLKKLDKTPSGVEAAEAEGGPMDIPGIDLGPRSLILTKSGKDKKRCDRLYVDGDGNGRMDKTECYDLTQSEGPVRVPYSERDYHYALVCPITLTTKAGQETVTHWLAVRVIQYRDSPHVSYGLADCVTGQVKIGDKTMRLALYDPSPAQEYRPMRAEGAGRRRGTVGCQLMLDANGNGTFDGLRLWGTGGENRWLTRLIRLGKRYYELDVAKGGGSVRIAPATPELGTVKLPAGVWSSSVIGPEFAAAVRGSDKEIRLPAGQYAVDRYDYAKGGARLTASDRELKALFEVKPGQSATFRAGPPLTMRVDCYPYPHPAKGRRPQSYRFQLALRDCAGREVSNASGLGGKRPPAPKLKIVDAKGKTVLDTAFEYG